MRGKGERMTASKILKKSGIVVPDTTAYNIAIVDDKEIELDRICLSKKR